MESKLMKTWAFAYFHPVDCPVPRNNSIEIKAVKVTDPNVYSNFSSDHYYLDAATVQAGFRLESNWTNQLKETQLMPVQIVCAKLAARYPSALQFLAGAVKQ